MLPANFQIHLDYSLEQRFMVEFTVSHRRRLIDVTTKEMDDVGIDNRQDTVYICICIDIITQSLSLRDKESSGINKCIKIEINISRNNKIEKNLLFYSCI